MFYSTNYQRYLAEFALFAFLVVFGLAVNSQALVALGILVLSHCLPSLVLASVRQFSNVYTDPVPTLYPDGHSNFREKEVVKLISCSIMIGVSVGLLVLSLQKIAFVPLSSAYKTIILGLVYIGFELSLYLLVNITSKSTPFQKPRKSRVVRIIVAAFVLLIGLIEHQLIQDLLDVSVGLAVLSYVTYCSALGLIEVARKNIEFSPRGIGVEDVKAFLITLPGVLSVGRVYFRRVNEHEHELGLHLTLQHFLLENSEMLKDRVKRELADEFGITSVTIELCWERETAPSSSRYEPESGVIALGHES